MNQGEVIAVFTPEVAIDQELHTYSGGLGVFAGGFFRSARKLNLPVVGVTILPREGYYDQYCDGERMGIRYVKRYYPHLLEDTGHIISVPIGSDTIGLTNINLKVWRLAGERFDTVDVYFLDADIDQEDSVREALSHRNTMQLYGGSQHAGFSIETRIVQSILVGKGGVEALRCLGYHVGLYHLNESHMAFAAVELFCQALREGKTYDEALGATRAKVIFTTHTPVRAGNPVYSIDMLMRLGGFNGTLTREYLERLGGEPSGMFNMTRACLRLSRKANAVSQKHLAVARTLWNGDTPTMAGITNGVCREYWQYPEFRDAAYPRDVANAKLLYKRRMLENIKNETGKCLSEHVLTVVWARRFAEYKRPKFLFYDLEWIKQKLIANTLQVIIAGKPHPDDFKMIGVWNELSGLGKALPNVVMVPGYELGLSRMLKGGADVWLNTPQAPDEACGTSGMSAAMNGAINVSTPDGWMAEANPENCFLFGSQWHASDQDAYDLKQLQKCFDEKICDMFYCRKEEWYQKAFAGMKEAESRFTSDRMVDEYRRLLYKG